MAHNQSDLKLFAARIRPHFEAELRDDAYRLALVIAHFSGAKVKDLRPETTMAEIVHWMNATDDFQDSLDNVELVMALEEEFGSGKTGDGRRDAYSRTFRDLVLERVRRQKRR